MDEIDYTQPINKIAGQIWHSRVTQAHKHAMNTPPERRLAIYLKHVKYGKFRPEDVAKLLDLSPEMVEKTAKRICRDWDGEFWYFTIDI